MYLIDLHMKRYEEVKPHMDTVVIPIGMIESHGPHGALATDVLIPREFVKRLEAVIGDKIMIAPEIPYGHSWALAPFPGTIDVSAAAFSQYVFEIGREFYRNGFANIVFFNGHGGNIPSLSTVAEGLADLGAQVLTLNWWMDYKPQILQIVDGPGHGGEDETAMVLAIDEGLVAIEAAGNQPTPLNPKLKYKEMGKTVFPGGYFGNAAGATAEKGERLYEALLAEVLKDFEALWRITHQEVQ